MEFITATESACRNLNISDATELKAKMVNVLCKHDKISDRNVSREESKAINDLKVYKLFMQTKGCHSSLEQRGLHKEVRPTLS